MSMNLGSLSHRFIAFTPSSLYPESPAGHGSETAHSKEDSRFDLRALLSSLSPDHVRSTVSHTVLCNISNQEV